MEVGLEVGLGSNESNLKVYIANRPPLKEFEQLDYLKPLAFGEVRSIADETGNHWRKIFNVFSKLIFALRTGDRGFVESFPSWQDYRDKNLLQSHSNESLLFSAPPFIKTTTKVESNFDVSTNSASKAASKTVHLVTGKSYAADLNLDYQKIDGDFGWNPSQKLIVCPYFDYRQLSNVKIDKLVELINSL